MNTSKKIHALVNEAIGLAEMEMERQAREILRKHSNLDEFICAMGSITFSVKGSDEQIGLDELGYMKKLFTFIDIWDEFFGLSGIPMRFTANGPKITEW